MRFFQIRSYGGGNNCHGDSGVGECQRLSGPDRSATEYDGGDTLAVQCDRKVAHRNCPRLSEARRNTTYSATTLAKVTADMTAARLACQPRSTLPSASALTPSQAPTPQMICVTTTARYSNEYAVASATPSVKPRNPAIDARWLTRSRVSSGGNDLKIAPKRPDLSSRRATRYIVPAAAAVAYAAMPIKLRMICRLSQTARAPCGSRNGRRPAILAPIVTSAATGAAISVRLTSPARLSTTTSEIASTSPAKESPGPRPVSDAAPLSLASPASAIACAPTPRSRARTTGPTGAFTRRANGNAAIAAAAR